MTTRLTITHHDDRCELIAETFFVDAVGQAETPPVRSQALPAGIPTCIALKPGNVLVVREDRDRREAASKGAA